MGKKTSLLKLVRTTVTKNQEQCSSIPSQKKPKQFRNETEAEKNPTHHQETTNKPKTKKKKKKKRKEKNA